VTDAKEVGVRNAVEEKTTVTPIALRDHYWRTSGKVNGWTIS
jgi:hypothetical protein